MLLHGFWQCGNFVLKLLCTINKSVFVFCVRENTISTIVSAEFWAIYHTKKTKRNCTNMTLSEDLEIDCCEEELSETQVSFYKNAIEEYEKALSEANQIKKGNPLFVVSGN